MEEHNPGQIGLNESRSAETAYQQPVPEEHTQINSQQMSQANPGAPAAMQQTEQNNLPQDTYINPVPPQSALTGQATLSQNSGTPPRQTEPEQYAQVTPAKPPETAHPETLLNPAAQPQTIYQQHPHAQQNVASSGQMYNQNPIQQPVYTFMDPATGQLYYSHTPPVMQQQPPLPQKNAYVQQSASETVVAPEQPQQAPPPNYGQVMTAVEEFAEGDASVGDVLKTLYATTAQDDQFWKGALVGAAATILLTSETVRGAMGKTLGAIMGAGTTAAAATGDGKESNSAKQSTKTQSTDVPKEETK